MEKLTSEHGEEISHLQQNYKIEVETLKDQLLESDARRESLEREVGTKSKNVHTSMCTYVLRSNVYVYEYINLCAFESRTCSYTKMWEEYETKGNS